jgi:predicted dehydrogenase
MSGVTVGIVGAGDITRIVHVPVLKNIHDVRIAWIADSDARRLRTLARAFDLEGRLVSEGEIELPPCDVVLLATPVHARRRYLEHFSERGSAILAEKPFALSEREHVQFLEICSSIQVACGYMRRTYATVRALRRMVRERWFGGLRAVRYSEGGRVSRSASSSKTLDLDYRMGGGVLRDLGCHGLDALLWITAATGVKVRSARLEWDDATDRQVESEFVLSGPDAAECSVQFTISWLTPQSNTIVAEFEHARISAGIGPESGLEIQGLPAGEKWTPLSLGAEGARSSYQAFYLEWADFLASVRTGKPGTFVASESLLTTRLVDAIYETGGGL